ncbi:Shedu immune nuclease family protein [Stenotrophomonas maltophilia]|uniref:Shedu immune nuclease family protein n=1 Tax=Stenotrophomonas maltophilia TaxID=40324 RepID=UPI003BF8D6CA
MSEEDGIYVANKVPGRIYGSSAFPVKGLVKDGERFTEVVRKLRYLDRVFPNIEGDALGVVKHEVVLRTTPTGKRQIKMLLVEDPRLIKSILLQSFDMSEGKDSPSRNAHFLITGKEIDELVELAMLAVNAEFRAEDKFRIGIDQLSRFTLSRDAAKQLIGKNEQLLEDILTSEVTERDLVTVAYRRRQLDLFERLLSDDTFFDEQASQVRGPEEVWQRFFEANHWIFGGSLFFNAAGAIDEGKLERVVAGASVVGPGKRADGLLSTRGRVGALCFAEIKTHRTRLLQKSQYRPGVWGPSSDLTDAVAQSQRTVHLAEANIREALRIVDDEGNPLGKEAYLIRPRSVLVCGDLQEFVAEHGVNREKFACFELFRRHLQGPEVVTFDELLERARLLVEQNG